MRELSVRIPRSSSRNVKGTFAKLLVRVQADASTGFGWEGTPVRPGSLIEWSELWPTPQHPRVPVLLECAGSVDPRDGAANKRSWPCLFVLWKFDLDQKDWIELARSASLTWTWAIDLRPIAMRAIEESQGAAVEVYGDFAVVVNRLHHLIDFELGKLPLLERARAVGALHDALFARLCQ